MSASPTQRSNHCAPLLAIKTWRMADYFHGELRHEYLDGILQEDGDFLLRKSSHGISVISVKWADKIRNIQPDFDGMTYSCVIKYICTALCQDVPREARQSFIAEMDMMATMRHPNIVQCVGTVEGTESGGEIRILLELINKGSLDSLLHRNKLTDRGKARMLVHVARGLSYLHRRNIIHRDLAARNILVHKNEDGSIIAKVSDFGLSRSDESGRGYQLSSTQKLPLRWLAPECFALRSWTKASDVWSFGVLLWEVYTNGAEPYSDICGLEDVRHLSKYISRGDHPSDIPDLQSDLRRIMLSCWRKSPADRPTMPQLVEELQLAYPKVRSVRLSSSHAESSGTSQKEIPSHAERQPEDKHHDGHPQGSPESSSGPSDGLTDFRRPY